MSREIEEVMGSFIEATIKGNTRECHFMRVLLEIRDRLDKLETLEAISQTLDKIHNELETIRLRGSQF